ncbi:hypothetical protein RM780_09830 [Streptomyces sp. DSM 44917]|uniref:Uncharacterized protein n=1 Tax=Streptomyces boetiae TaxID=3075541 RepID=A0ABU2L6S6_9ACTN|nr:hypothetical protein [Streptomyces sp. DSM 44917]MDT0307261.1 hypothetical protein [Streptomyces sp. DSM 44917]
MCRLLDGRSGGAAGPAKPESAAAPERTAVAAVENADGSVTLTLPPGAYDALQLQLAIGAAVMGPDAPFLP